MKNKFSVLSSQSLATCHLDLVLLMTELLKYADVTIICGHRAKAEQDAAYNSNRSKVKWPNSKHNSLPSMAVDVALHPINWADTHSFSHLAGRIMQIADQLLEQGAISHRVTWGGDWNRDGFMDDTKFFDAPHIQLEAV
jgi:peptidoglycan L-alanyl-D-glutamate endopeptidase CwlK